MSDILDEVHDLFGGTHYGRYVAIICPYHEDTTPSCLVYPDGYRCEACGKTGKTEWLLEDNSLLVFPTTPSKPFENPFTKWASKYDLPMLLKHAWERNIENPSEYLTKRGIAPKFQLRYGIGKIDNWFTLPIYDRDGKIVGATARAGENNDSPAKYVNPRGQDPSLLYVPDWTILKTRLCLTFGILDAVTLALLNIPAASTTTGKHLNTTALEWFRGEILVIPDKGEELDGYKLDHNLGSRARLHIPNYSKDKDVNGEWEKREESVNDWIRDVLRL